MVHASNGGDRFEDAWRAHRPHLVDVAFRMLGDVGAAEDVVQEAFTRLLHARQEEIDDARGWLTVVTSRLCLDQLKSARSRRERAESHPTLDARLGAQGSIDPADRVTLDEGVRLALVVMIERLTPPERVAFVLHDVFRMPFELVAETVGRTPAACRQLASRARRALATGAGTDLVSSDAVANQLLAERFLAACATGDVDGLLAVLDPEVSGTVDLEPDQVVVGSAPVAANLLRYWGDATLVSYPVGGRLVVLAFRHRALAGVLLLDVEGGRVAEIHVLAAPDALSAVGAQLAALRAIAAGRTPTSRS
jgi:RNA polymerase sigma-70 factor (ECF subfamily)